MSLLSSHYGEPLLGPAGHLQGHFEAFSPFEGMPDTVSLVNMGGVQLNTLLDSQHRQAGISFILCVGVCV